MLRTLDPHSNFFEQRDYLTMQERQKWQYYGLGITVVSVDGNITVVSPFEGTPAHRLGIRAGDIISKIEGEDAAFLGPAGAGERKSPPRAGQDGSGDRAADPSGPDPSGAGAATSAAA